MSSPEQPVHRPAVFFDKRGHRRRAVHIIGIPLAILTTVLIGFFVISVLVNPFLPQIRLKPFVSCRSSPIPLLMCRKNL